MEDKSVKIYEKKAYGMSVSCWSVLAFSRRMENAVYKGFKNWILQTVSKLYLQQATLI